MDAATTATAVLIKTPFLVPLTGFAAFTIVFALLVLALWLVAVAVLAPLQSAAPRAARGSGDPMGTGGSVAGTHTTFIVTAYVPGLGQVAGSFTLVTDQIKTLLSSLLEFIKVSFVVLIIAALIAGLGLVLRSYDNTIVGTVAEIYACNILPIVNIVLQVVNIVVFLAGIAWAGVTFVTSLMFLQGYLWLRVLLTCAAANASTVLEAGIIGIANALADLFAAINAYLTSGDLGHARIDLLPFMARIGDLSLIGVSIADCLCSYIDFFWVLTFGLFQEDALAVSVDGIVNMALRLLQLVANSIVEADAPDWSPFFAESIRTLLALGDVVGVLVVYVFNVVAGFLDLIPLAMVATPTTAEAATNMAALGYGADDLAALLQRLQGIPAATASSGGVPTASLSIDTVRIIMAVRRPDVMRVALAGNLSDVIGLRYLIGVFETPWPRVVTNLGAGLLALANNTLNLFRLTTHTTNSYADIAYFQFGYAFDWWRDAGFALGKVAAVFYGPLEMPVADIPNIVTGVVQIIFELGIHLFFDNIYLFPADGNIFKFFVTYCLANNTGASENYRLLYNHSAAIAELFGCNPAGDAPFALESPGAVCADNVAGCLGLSIYRILVEVVDLVERHVCYLSELVQFNKDKVHFGYISYDPLFRALIHFAECIRRLFYWLDTPLQSIGDPPGQPCQYAGPNGQTLFKRSFLCAIGNVVDAGLLFFDSILYELLRLARSLLETFAQVPNVAVEIPTLASANADFKAALCQFGAVIGSLVPVTFSCSAQAVAYRDSTSPATSIGIPEPPPTIPPTTQTTAPVPVVPTARRDTTRVCTYSRTAWATEPLGGCNCSTTGALAWGVNQTAPPAPACFLECLQPGVDFPFFVGAQLLPNAAFGGTVPVDTLFSNASTLRAFLRATLPMEGQGVAPGVATPSAFGETVDPTGAEAEADFVAELVVATLNERFHRLYNPAFDLAFNLGTPVVNSTDFVNGTLDVNGTCGSGYINTSVNGSAVAFIAGVQPAIGRVSVRQYVDLMNRFTYAMAQYGSAGYNSLFSPTLAADGAVNPANILARQIDAFVSWPVAGNWSTAANALLEGLRLYNRAYLSCRMDTAEAACFTPFRVVQPSASPQPWDTPLAPAVLANATGAVSVVTWSAVDFGQVVFDGLDCDCSASYRHYYDTTLRRSPFAGACLLLCDGPAYPYLLGERPDQTFVAGFSEMNTGLEVTGLGGLRGVLLDGQLPLPATYGTAEYGQETRDAAVDVSRTRALAGLLLASRFNLQLLQRYLPNRYLFLRPYGDPILNSCGLFNATLDAQLWGGVRMDLMVDVLTTIFYGDLNTERDCLRHYAYATRVSDPRYALCAKFVQRFGTGTSPSTNLVTWNNLLKDTAYVILQRLTTFRPQGNVSLGNDCFIIATLLDSGSGLAVLPPSNFTEPLADPALPPLDFVSVLYYAIPTDDVRTILPCAATISCTSETFCSGALLLGAPGDVAVSVLTQINLAVATGAGTWTLGTGLWDLAKNVIIGETQHAGAFILHLMSLGDCAICAIAGNVAGDFCANGIFRVFRTAVVTLQTLASIVISFAIDTISFIFTVIADFFSGLFPELWTAVVAYVTSFLNDLIVPFFETFIGFILGAICVCDNWWNPLFATTLFSCTNSDICPAKKRAGAFAFGLSSSLSADGEHLLYQTFAPDWPSAAATTYANAWNASHPCATSMPALAPFAATGSLTRDQANEAAYCLGLAVLYHENGLDTPLALYAADECQYLMDDLRNQAPSVPSGASSYAVMDAFQRTIVLKCVNERAHVHGIKRASGGRLDFLPSNILATNDGIPATLVKTWLPMLLDWMAAQTVASHRSGDSGYLPSVVAGADYQASLRTSYGQARADLVTQYTTTGVLADHEAYASAILSPSSPSTATLKRRAATTATMRVRITRVAQMAATIDMLGTAFDGTLMPAYVDRIAARAAALPSPLYIVDGAVPSADVANATSSLDPTASGGSSQQQITTLMARMQNTATRAFVTLYTSSSSGSPDTMRRRSASAANEARAAVGGGIRLLGGAMRAGLTMAREVVSGRAHLNATAAVPTNASMTIVRWQLPNATNVPSYAAAGMPSAAAYFAVGPAAATVATPDGPRPILVPRSAAAAAAANRRLTFIGESASRNWRITMAAKTRFGARIDELQRMSLELARQAGDEARVKRNPLERARRMGTAVAAVREMWTRYGSDKNAFAAAAALNGTGCLSGVPELCTQCYALDQAVGYTLAAVLRVVGYAASTAPEPWNRLDYTYQQFLSVQRYVTNTSEPLRLGSSPSLPAGFPSPDYSVFAYLDDPLPKYGFQDVADLADATWAFFSNAFPSLTDPSTWNLAITANGEKTLVAAAARDGHRRYQSSIRAYFATSASAAALRRRLPRPSRPEYTIEGTVLPAVISQLTPVVQMGARLASGAFGGYGNGTSPVRQSSVVFTSLLDVVLGWIEFVFFWLFSCDYLHDLDGTKLRTSLTIAAFAAGTVTIALGLLLQQIPGIGPFILSFLSGGSIILLAAGITLSVSTNWSLLCGTALPQVLWSKLIMHTLTEVLVPQCIILGTGLANEPYENDQCRSCALWEAGTWTFASPRDDLGWTNALDPLIFALRQWAFDVLQTLRDPTQWNVLLQLFIGSDLWQDWTTRWDGVDLRPSANPDPILYRQQWTAWGIVLFETLLILPFIVALLAFAPTLALIKLALALILAILAAGAAFAVGGFFVLVYLVQLRNVMVDRALALEAELVEAQERTVRADKRIIKHIEGMLARKRRRAAAAAAPAPLARRVM